MDNQLYVTVVSVHTPLIQFSSTGSYYTSYAISLKSNNPCFTHAYSQIRRRYSEFHHLKRLLADHHPTIVKPPQLPPKTYFHRFSDTFIEERKKGLQKFLEQVLAIPVFLSYKGLHLFLQSSLSMSQIDEQCLGDIPIPHLVDDKPMHTQIHSDISSSSSSERCHKEASNRTLENLKESDLKSEDIDSDESGYSSPKLKQHNIPKNHICNSTAPCLIPRRPSSIDSSPCSSTSSLDTSYSSPKERNRNRLRSRRVSFNESVTVAVVYNQLWNINVQPIRTSV